MKVDWKDAAEEVLRDCAVRSPDPGPSLLRLRAEVERRVREDDRWIVYGADVALTYRDLSVGERP
jgi:hypothetical protein